jgi:hypothetical protein
VSEAGVKSKGLDRNGICLFDRSSFMCNLGAQTVKHVLSNTPRLKESNEPKSRLTISEELGWQVGRILKFESVHDQFHFQSILVFPALNLWVFESIHVYIYIYIDSTAVQVSHFQATTLFRVFSVTQR